MIGIITNITITSKVHLARPRSKPHRRMHSTQALSSNKRSNLLACSKSQRIITLRQAMLTLALVIIIMARHKSLS